MHADPKKDFQPVLLGMGMFVPKMSYYSPTLMEMGGDKEKNQLSIHMSKHSLGNKSAGATSAAYGLIERKS